MKKILLLFVAIIAISCSKNDDETSSNTLIGTKWTANDDIAQIVWGGTCTTSIEFLTESNCQQIDIHGTGYLKSTTVAQGTYKYWGDSVSWTIDSKTIKGKITGSALNSTRGTLSGSKLIYIKE